MSKIIPITRSSFKQQAATLRSIVTNGYTDDYASAVQEAAGVLLWLDQLQSNLGADNVIPADLKDKLFGGREKISTKANDTRHEQ